MILRSIPKNEHRMLVGDDSQGKVETASRVRAIVVVLDRDLGDLDSYDRDLPVVSSLVQVVPVLVVAVDGEG
eukprot:754575-Hanusia_phi.AAC.6